MRTINLTTATGNSKELPDNTSLPETLYLLSSAANAIRLRAALSEADMSLPPGARVLGPGGVQSY